MNNVEEFYSNKRFLNLVEVHSQRNSSFFYRVYSDENSIKIVLEDSFIKALKGNEKADIQYIIQDWINKKREEIEDYLIYQIKTRLKEARERVNEDFKILDKGGKK